MKISFIQLICEFVLIEVFMYHNYLRKTRDFFYSFRLWQLVVLFSKKTYVYCTVVTCDGH